MNIEVSRRHFLQLAGAVADHYSPIRPGTDIAFLSGVINYPLTNDNIQKEYVRN